MCWDGSALSCPQPVHRRCDGQEPRGSLELPGWGRTHKACLGERHWVGKFCRGAVICTPGRGDREVVISAPSREARAHSAEGRGCAQQRVQRGQGMPRRRGRGAPRVRGVAIDLGSLQHSASPAPGSGPAGQNSPAPGHPCANHTGRKPFSAGNPLPLLSNCCSAKRALCVPSPAPGAWPCPLPGGVSSGRGQGTCAVTEHI